MRSEAYAASAVKGRREGSSTQDHLESNLPAFCRWRSAALALHSTCCHAPNARVASSARHLFRPASTACRRSIWRRHRSKAAWRWRSIPATAFASRVRIRTRSQAVCRHSKKAEEVFLLNRLAVAVSTCRPASILRKIRRGGDFEATHVLLRKRGAHRRGIYFLALIAAQVEMLKRSSIP